MVILIDCDDHTRIREQLLTLPDLETNVYISIRVRYSRPGVVTHQAGRHACLFFCYLIWDNAKTRQFRRRIALPGALPDKMTAPVRCADVTSTDKAASVGCDGCAQGCVACCSVPPVTAFCCAWSSAELPRLLSFRHFCARPVPAMTCPAPTSVPVVVVFQLRIEAAHPA